MHMIQDSQELEEELTFQTQLAANLQQQVQLLDMQDTVKNLQENIKKRTPIEITTDMSFLTRTKIKIENLLYKTEHLSLANHATSAMFLVSAASTIGLYIIYNFNLNIDAVTITAFTGILSEIGTALENKYGITNSVPAQTTPINPPINTTPTDSTDPEDQSDSTDPTITTESEDPTEPDGV